jgi:uncharacterized lipoprotein YmbA
MPQQYMSGYDRLSASFPVYCPQPTDTVKVKVKVKVKHFLSRPGQALRVAGD